METTRFFGKLALFGLLLATVIGLVFSFVLPPEYADTFAIIYRKLDYLKHASSPKVVLLGGSNVLMGIDSGLLEQRFGRPVVNMGLQVSIPLSVQLNEIEAYLRPGDLVVISAEYGAYVYPEGIPDILARQLEVYPAGFFQLDLANVEQIPSILKTMFQGKVDRLRSRGALQLANLAQVFDPAGHLPQVLLDQFDPQGDFVAHLDLPGRPIATKMLFGINQVNPQIFTMLNQVEARIKAKGAAVVLTFPSSRQSNCTATGEAFQVLYWLIKSNVSMPVAGTPESYCYPDQYFFDTEYHLLRQGREIRTEQMVRDLKGFIK